MDRPKSSSGIHRTINNRDPRLFRDIEYRPETVPPDSDPELLERIAEACSSGSPRKRQDVMLALLVDGLEVYQNCDIVVKYGLPRETASRSRQRGLKLLRSHRDLVVGMLLGAAAALG